MSKAFNIGLSVAIGTLTFMGLEHERKQTPEYKREEMQKEIKAYEDIRRYYYREKAKGRHVKRAIKTINNCIKETRKELKAI